MVQIQNQMKRSSHENNDNLHHHVLRSESFGSSGYYNYYNPAEQIQMMEKRQLFLRSYQFSRKKSLGDKIKGSLVRVKKLVCLRLRSARKRFQFSVFRIKCGFYYRKYRKYRKTNAHSYSYFFC